jgi:hypothetical protein
MKTYEITFSITTETDPCEWDWGALLDPSEGESYLIKSITEGGE